MWMKCGSGSCASPSPIGFRTEYLLGDALSVDLENKHPTGVGFVLVNGVLPTAADRRQEQRAQIGSPEDRARGPAYG